jgi:hypothetical protein
MNRAQTTEPDDYDDDLEYGHCGNIGCDEGWVFDCFDGLCVNAEDGCELCMRRCDWCNPRKASADTHPKDGDATEIAAPLVREEGSNDSALR